MSDVYINNLPDHTVEERVMAIVGATTKKNISPEEKESRIKQTLQGYTNTVNAREISDVEKQRAIDEMNAKVEDFLKN